MRKPIPEILYNTILDIVERMPRGAWVGEAELRIILACLADNLDPDLPREQEDAIWQDLQGALATRAAVHHAV